MNYNFPEIVHIDDVLPAIKGNPEFIVARKDKYDVINYLVSTPDTFPIVKTKEDAIRRECRGLVFDKDGYLIARRFQKFFNAGEREETSLEKIDLSKPHQILEKLDGSMITPIPLEDEYVERLVWGTKMGETDVSKNVKEFLEDQDTRYEDFSWLWIERGYTPIFEWCSRKNRIVVDHPVDRLVLTAIRKNLTGEYVPYDVLRSYAETYGIDYVKSYGGAKSSMEALMRHTQDLEGMEGYVIRFDDGYMVKLKGAWYLRIHKVRDDLTSEKKLLTLIINDGIDDLKPLMLEDDRKRVEEFERLFWNGIELSIKAFEEMFKKYESPTRKEFAEKIKNLDGITKQILFSMLDGELPMVAVRRTIQKNLGSSTKIENVRPLWFFLRWSYGDYE